MTAPAKHKHSKCQQAAPQLRGIALLLTALLGFGLAGCDNRAAELCDDICDCVRCNDREYESCVNDVEAQLDTADAYDCGDYADEYMDCVLSNRNDCILGVWVPFERCIRDYDDAGDCIDRRSSL